MQLLSVTQLDLRTLYALPGGRRLISRGIGLIAPYSGSIGARVVALAEGHAMLRMPDRRRNRNHLASIHACALSTLAETTAGLSVLYSLPRGMRGIAVHLGIDYHAKARGPIVAATQWSVPASGQTVERDIVIQMTDSDEHRVATSVVRYRLAPSG